MKDGSAQVLPLPPGCMGPLLRPQGSRTSTCARLLSPRGLEALGDYGSSSRQPGAWPMGPPAFLVGSWPEQVKELGPSGPTAVCWLEPGLA